VFQTSLPEAPQKLRHFKDEVYCNVCLEQVKDSLSELNIGEEDHELTENDILSVYGEDVELYRED
jgi:hypothetical protein